MSKSKTSNLPEKHIFLVGMMGTGKSVVSRSLSRLIKRPSYDLDRIIEEKISMSIQAFFKSKGEAAFRQLEHEVLKEVADKNAWGIVATGGGIVVRPDNLKLMKERGIMVYLQTDIEILWKRVSRTNHRPLLQQENPREVLEKLFNQRKPFYEQADTIVDTSQSNALSVAKRIKFLIT